MQSSIQKVFKFGFAFILKAGNVEECPCHSLAIGFLFPPSSSYVCFIFSPFYFLLETLKKTSQKGFRVFCTLFSCKTSLCFVRWKGGFLPLLCWPCIFARRAQQNSILLLIILGVVKGKLHDCSTTSKHAQSHLLTFSFLTCHEWGIALKRLR